MRRPSMLTRSTIIFSHRAVPCRVQSGIRCLLDWTLYAAPTLSRQQRVSAAEWPRPSVFRPRPSFCSNWSSSS